MKIESDTVLAIKKIHEQGHLIAIINNKGYKESLHYIEEIKPWVHFFVANNGAILIDDIKKELLKTPKTINLEFINNILQDIKLINGAAQIITSKKTYIHSSINFLKSDNWLSKKDKNINIVPFSKYEKETIVKKSEVIQLIIILDPELIDELLIYFKRFYNNDYEFKLSSPISLDINVAGVNNYEGIKTIMLLYKIKPQNVFAFGNSACDTELMTDLKNTYATKNAMPIIQKLSKFIIDINETNTLAMKIEKIIKR